MKVIPEEEKSDFYNYYTIIFKSVQFSKTNLKLCKEIRKYYPLKEPYLRMSQHWSN
jgi:hypothetical protein